ncbi:MAG: guanylate kinase [Dehalococcoidia bacterium]
MTQFSDLKQSPSIFLISGPSGVGKDTIIEELRSNFPNYFYAITATSRPKRDNETDGKHYLFLSEEQFQKLIDNNEMLEWANVYGNYYGVPASPIIEAIKLHKTIIIKIDVQGVESFKKIFPHSVSIFITPDQPSDLIERLKSRNPENAIDIQSRLNSVAKELTASKNFDHVVVNINNLIESTINQIQTIIQQYTI